MNKSNTTMSSFFSITKKSWSMIITLAVIAAVYAYYFFIYVDNKEKLYHERAFRTLTRVAKNIDAKRQNFEGIIRINSNARSNSLKKREKENAEKYNLSKQSLNKILFEDDNNTYYSETDIDQFVSPLVKLGFFEEFLIVRGKTSIAYQTFDNKVTVNDTLPLIDQAFPLLSGNTSKFKINNNTYIAYVHQMAFNEEHWKLIGCVKESTFASATRDINFWIILYASLVLLIIIVAMSLLKLVFMSERDRLSRGNVCFTGISIVVGSSLILLFFLIIYSYFGYGLFHVDKKLDTLSKQIDEKFIGEVKRAYTQLNSYEDSLLTYLDNKNDNSANQILNNNLLNHSFYPYFNEVFWLDKNGKQLYQFTTRENKDELVSLSKRRYFKDVRDEIFWKMPESGEEFVFQSIISWATMSNEVAISKKSINQSLASVAVITTKLSSVMDAILPLGYGFAFLEEDGNVVLHSDKEKVLQENFLHETEQKNYFKAAISSHTSLITSIDYNGKEQRVIVKPINSLPLTLVVFYDLEIEKTKDAEVWFFTLVLILLSFFIALIFIFILYVTRYKKSDLKTTIFFLNWLRPKGKRKPVYIGLIVSNLFTIVLLLVYIDLYNKDVIHTAFRTSLTPALVFCLSYINIYGYVIEKDNREKKNHLKLFIIISVILLLIINLIHIAVFSYHWENIIYQVLLCIPFLILLLNFKWLKALFKVTPSFHNLEISTNLYSWLLFLWLFSTSLLPMWAFFTVAYSQESEIWTRHELFDFMQKEEKYYTVVQNDFSKVYNEGLINDSLRLQKSEDGIYKVDINNITGGKPMKLNPSYHKFLFYARPNFRDLIGINRGLVFSKSSDNKFQWLKFENKNSIGIIYSSEIHQKLMNKATDTLSLEINNFVFFDSQKKEKFINIAVLHGSKLLVLIILYFFIRYAITTIYALGSAFKLKAAELNKEALTDIWKSKKHILLLGLANSGRFSLLQELGLGNEEIIDCINASNDASWNTQNSQIYSEIRNKHIAIVNLEYDFHNYTANRRKLRLLETLIHNKNKIIVVSKIDPIEIVGFYRDIVNDSGNEELNSQIINDMYAIRDIFSHFVRLYKRIEEIEISNSKLTETVINEIKFGTYLPSLQKLLESKFEEDDIESAILEVQELAQPYYIALWNTLTKEERFVVYDLAQNDFVNIKNGRAITSLQKKGILIWNERLRLFNKSFANYVLVANKEEALMMEKEEKNKGSWHNVRNILILIIISLLVLIGFGKPDFFKNINAIVLAIAGVAGVLPSLTNVFNFSQKFKGA